MFREQQRIDQVVADALGEDFAHMLGGARVIQHPRDIWALGQGVPQAPIEDAGRFAGHDQQPQVMVDSQTLQPLADARKAGRGVGHIEQVSEFILIGVDRQQRHGPVSHVHADVPGQLIEIRIE